MKFPVLRLALLAAVCLPRPAVAQPAATPPPAWPDHSRLLPARLRGIPTGLALVHTPGLVRPRPDPGQPGRYV